MKSSHENLPGRGRAAANPASGQGKARTLRALIALELGAEWPAWLAARIAGMSRYVVVQRDGESSTAFSTRTAALEGARHLDSVFLLCNGRTDAQQMAARRALATPLRRALSKSASAELVFATAPEFEARSRSALNQLATEFAPALAAPRGARRGSAELRERSRPQM